MAQKISCECTRYSPDAACERGSRLFEAAKRASQTLVDETSTEERRAVYTLRHLAYIDHLLGWWEGDVKVQRRMEVWMLSCRVSGRWVLRSRTQDDTQVQMWLSMMGYQHFVGIGEQAKDRLSGYYRKSDGHPVGGNMSFPLLSEQISGVRVPDEQVGMLAGQIVRRSAPSTSRVDLKTQVTVRIALLVARIPHSPTMMERLSVQRRAADLLQAHGIQVGPLDEQTLRELIDEAVQQKERMNGSSARNTKVLQE